MNIAELDYQKLSGIVPAIIQDATTKDVLMLGFMNEESLRETVKRQKVVFFSRTRQRLWMKGEESGNFLEVCEICFDCDRDTLLIMVNLVGDCVCHTGNMSCFYTKCYIKKNTYNPG